MSLSLVSMLMPKQTSGFDFSTLYSNAAGGGAAPAYGVGSVDAALDQAEKNEDKQLALVAQQPDVQRELAHYKKVVSKAKSFEEILDDPIARTVLMKAHGLGDQVQYVGMAKKAMMSDPADPNSVAVKLASVNGAWLEFAKTFNIPKNGLEKLHPQQDGFAAQWRITIQREGEPQEALLAVTKVRGGWEGKLDGVVVPIEIRDGLLKTSYVWKDSDEDLKLTRLEARVGRDGVSLKGDQFDDGVEADVPWTAVLYNNDAVQKVSDNYIAEKRLDMLDQQLPGLGSAVLFKKIASTLDTPVKILGSALGREIVTTAFGIPKQIALQSYHAQEKAITQRLDPASLKNPAMVDKIVQRYLIQLNGGLSGLTV